MGTLDNVCSCQGKILKETKNYHLSSFHRRRNVLTQKKEENNQLHIKGCPLNGKAKLSENSPYLSSFSHQYM